MIGIDVLEHTERQLTVDEAKDLYASWSDIVRQPCSPLFTYSLRFFL